jgi:hypothetical protein
VKRRDCNERKHPAANQEHAGYGISIGLRRMKRPEAAVYPKLVRRKRPVERIESKRGVGEPPPIGCAAIWWSGNVGAMILPEKRYRTCSARWPARSGYRRRCLP